MNTSDFHASPNDLLFHIPVFFGDDFTFSNATHNFLFFDKLGKLLSKHSKSRYGIQMDYRYSTFDEYL